MLVYVCVCVRVALTLLAEQNDTLPFIMHFTHAATFCTLLQQHFFFTKNKKDDKKEQQTNKTTPQYKYIYE